MKKPFAWSIICFGWRLCVRSRFVILPNTRRSLWVSSIPHERGCFTRAWDRDEEHEPDEWIEVKTRREPELPALPTQCKDWVNQTALRNKEDLPELPSKITRQIKNPDWREGSDQPETIPRSEHLENHPAIQRTWDRYVEENGYLGQSHITLGRRFTKYILHSLPSIRRKIALGRNMNSYSVWAC